MSEEKVTPSVLALLKADLGFFGSEVGSDMDAYLTSILEYSEKELHKASIFPDTDNVEDAMLVAMFGAWVYRNRVTGVGKPPMLKEAMRNWQIHRITSTAEEGNAQ